MRSKILTLTVFILALLSVSSSQSQQLSGQQIMETVLSKSNWKDMSADLTLTITSAQGEQRVRKIKMYSRKRNPNENDMLMRFIFPADVKGTGFLLIEHADRDDDRYLFLPALRRTKRITSSGRGSNFMASDFTYYDIGRPKLKDWKYHHLPDETINGIKCYKIESLPASADIEKDVGYSKIIHWVRQDNWTIIQAHYFDRTGKLWKILQVPGIQKIDGVWFQTHLVMKDIQANRTSEIKFENIKVNQKLPANFFTQRYLQRWH